MARIIILDISKRVKPRLVTPAKGSTGDLTNESQRPLTDIDFILKRYAGNLAELNAWKSKQKYGDQSALPDDLVDAFNVLKDAHDAFDNLPDNPFSSFDDAMAAIADGTFIDKIVPRGTSKEELLIEPIEPKKEGVNDDEKKENK